MCDLISWIKTTNGDIKYLTDDEFTVLVEQGRDPFDLIGHHAIEGYYKTRGKHCQFPVNAQNAIELPPQIMRDFKNGKFNKMMKSVRQKLTLNKDGIWTHEGWYENGQQEYKHNYKDDNRHGLYEGWYENGQQKYKHNYKDDNRHGLYEFWYENGQQKYKHNYKDGNCHGLYEGWYKNGQQEYKHNYKDDNRHGLYEGWYENGQQKYKYNYKDDNRHGLYEGWYENGQQEYKYNYKDDKLIK